MHHKPVFNSQIYAMFELPVAKRNVGIKIKPAGMIDRLAKKNPPAYRRILYIDQPTF